jgi:hypothetical protein
MVGTRTGKAARQHASVQGLHPFGVHALGWPWWTWLPIIIAVALGAAHEANPRAKERPMSYGHAERTVALIRQLEAEARRLSDPAGARTAPRTRRSGRQHNHWAIFRTASSAIPAAILKSVTPK